jgi:magnesium-protoporphyrin O-methyltransferase
MQTLSYRYRRREIETYFDRTAVHAWTALTSTTPVGRIRQTVRAGRDTMRSTILSWLPEDLTGRRILDAGCGTGAFAVEAARRGADVVAVDLSPALVSVAQERSTELLRSYGDGNRKPTGSIEFLPGDMLDPSLGRFDHVIAMDSLIHYVPVDVVGMLTQLAPRTSQSIIFTFAPRTPALSAMHFVGRMFPRKDRAPSIEPVDPKILHQHVSSALALQTFECRRTQRVDSGFYISQAMELSAR